MGMYTELMIRCYVKPRNQKVKDVLNYLFGTDFRERPENLPKHKFFNLEFWEMVGCMSSVRHNNENPRIYDGEFLFCICVIKNYSEELDLFLDWIRPHVKAKDGEVFAWTWYEEELIPILWRK